MRTIAVERLTTDGFLPFGFFADILQPQSEKLGAPPIEFFRDQVQQDLGGTARVFHVPAGTMVVLRPGVWHHAPFTTNHRSVNILITLPERTYANDCTVVEFAPADQIAIQLKPTPREKRK